MPSASQAVVTLNEPSEMMYMSVSRAPCFTIISPAVTILFRARAAISSRAVGERSAMSGIFSRASMVVQPLCGIMEVQKNPFPSAG